MKKEESSFFGKKEAKKLLAILLLCAGLFLPLHAETRSIDGSAWAINGADILLRVIVPDQIWQELPGENGGAISTNALGQYILTHYGASSAKGACPAIDLGYDLGKITPMALTAGQRRYELMLRCPSASGITLIDSAFFTEIPGHRGIASITIDNGPAARQEFSSTRRQIALPTLSLAASHEIGEGFSHFWHSIDLALLTLGLAALCGFKRDLFWPLAGFAGGVALSLALTALQITDPVDGSWVAAYLLLVLGGEIAARHDPRAVYFFAILSLLVASAAILRHQPWPEAAALALLGTGYLRWRVLRPNLAALWMIPAALLGIAEGLEDWPDLSFFGRPPLLPLGSFAAGTLLAASLLIALCWLARRGLPLSRWSPLLAAALAGAGSYLVLVRL